MIIGDPKVSVSGDLVFVSVPLLEGEVEVKTATFSVNKNAESAKQKMIDGLKAEIAAKTSERKTEVQVETLLSDLKTKLGE